MRYFLKPKATINYQFEKNLLSPFFRGEHVLRERLSSLTVSNKLVWRHRLIPSFVTCDRYTLRCPSTSEDQKGFQPRDKKPRELGSGSNSRGPRNESSHLNVVAPTQSCHADKGRVRHSNRVS
jgi:hypothetical protein